VSPPERLKETQREIKAWQAIMDHLRANAGQAQGRVAHRCGRCAGGGGAGVLTPAEN